jgi:SAM-dependent methyltransferase
MPDEALLARMYGAEYGASSADPFVEDPKQPERVLSFLEGLRPGVFVDYGCGSGTLLKRVQARNWTAKGVEYTVDVAVRTSRECGVPVLQISDLSSILGTADVVHLGDVIEHLPRPGEELERVFRLLRPGGILIAQGPLESGPSLFTYALKAARQARDKPVAMPPYHVLQATIWGQREFFRRMGLQEIAFEVTEVSWPAPNRWSPRLAFHPRALALYLLRKVSQAWSALSRGSHGNRYFYAGRWNAAVAAGQHDPESGAARDRTPT